MNRTELQIYIAEIYGVDAEYPWVKYPNYAVFRHASNQKWFALMMDVPKGKLGLPGEGILDVLNLKCDPVMLGTLRSEPGFFPAYHMSKNNWVTVSLDGSANADTIKMLLDLSYDLTAPRAKKHSHTNGEK